MDSSPSSSSSRVPIPAFPPLAALFLAHFDDLKGQTTVYYASLPDLPVGHMEHQTLPSGLHTLQSDLVCFTHGPGDLPGVGVFKSKIVNGQGRGRRMGTLGVVLAQGAMGELFALQEPLERVWEMISTHDRDPFTADLDATKTILDAVWAQCAGSIARRKDEVGVVREMVQGKTVVHPSHPISYFPALLVVLDPLIVTVYKHALAGKRILLYSPPPLLPLSAFAWCLQAMSLPPVMARDADVSPWIGHIGLMDLDNVKQRHGGWIATTSDAIYKSHTKLYDLFVDLSWPSARSISSTTATTTTTNTSPTPTPLVRPLPSRLPGDIPDGPYAHAALHLPNPNTGETTQITYAFPDIPLYRSLLLLQLSPPSVTISSKLGVRGNLWVWAFEVLERAWNLCKGVCEYALGHGNVGDIALSDGEEDARLIDDQAHGDSLMDEDEEEEDGEGEGGGREREDEAIRVGRLLLRQFHHNTYHLHARLQAVRRGTGGPLTETEVRELVGRSWRLGRLLGSDEGRWWNSLATTWGIAMGDSDSSIARR